VKPEKEGPPKAALPVRYAVASISILYQIQVRRLEAPELEIRASLAANALNSLDIGSPPFVD
jgi:hypothetical protein